MRHRKNPDKLHREKAIQQQNRYLWEEVVTGPNYTETALPGDKTCENKTPEEFYQNLFDKPTEPIETVKREKELDEEEMRYRAPESLADSLLALNVHPDSYAANLIVNGCVRPELIVVDPIPVKDPFETEE